MKKIYIYMAMASVSAGLCSCGKFLEESSQDEIRPTSANDYKELIAGEIYSKANNTLPHPYLDIMTDDCEDLITSARLGSDTRGSGFGYFTWQQSPEEQISDVRNNDPSWGFYYHQILVSNMILYDIDEKNGTEQEKNLVKAEALAIRAYAYFMLVNLYGEPYSPETASTALGVPVNSLISAENAKFTRASVAEIYDIIVDDFGNALKYFKAAGTTSSIWRWNVNAVNLMLARTYLYMQRWDDAIRSANDLLAVKADLWDLNEKAESSQADQYFVCSQNPEILFSFGYYYITYFATGAKGGFPASEDLRNSYETGDLRCQGNTGHYIQFQGSTLFGNRKRHLPYKGGYTSDTGVHGYAFRTAEAYLTRAEALSHTSGYLDAIDDLNTLRSKRFSPESYAPLQGGSQQEVINAVKEERRREMCFEQLRWFDLRRWGCPRITHYYTPDVNETAVIYTLEENDPAYTLPIPKAVIEQEPDLQDIQRPVRNPE
ncbi:MAG: RagB/SusD family nutrient uptake outer membrane protein [Clostridium sp.]|nr:RagB/SusD family nutrient uptake outer membrane protein [Bacteroides sp.]MCM1198173.1 RagB/SusD family nutrient uptake outer membrane protein [Clostridium sp.]